MKFLALFTALLLTNVALAAQDSVGVFHRPEKVIVLINEIGEAARLQNFMTNLNEGISLQKISDDKTIKFICKRTQSEASCTFTFLPGEKVEIGNRTLAAHTTLEDLKIESAEDFSASFESSRGDKFTLEIADGSINFYANKKQK